MKHLRSFFIVAALSIVLLIAGCGKKEFESNMDVKMQNFEHTNQNNEKVGLNDLKGKVWLADLIFTSCTTVCQPMTKNMADLQKMLEKEGVEDYHIVSFSVDPEVDTPEKLKDYISHFEADEKKWDLLTGYDPEYIREFAEKNLQTLAVPDPNSNQVMHGTSFYLVNKEGTVVKNYSGAEEVPFEEIVQDVKTLVEQD
ncbi:SCO family protein [Pseudobacillus wudalianchiensis]|uniref:Cytochrome c oxidase assembly protein n=1 Tax=Pseudobacillus wudalianchiensis TaxID=1743143 RepID=A0A1B9AIR8_9BACI|nr:SCO family protein [Bacillus wudalianchiensis]OCA83732.1 cytochrome c oxidase assembly protein [Bacillus wudalianchiensis]